MTTDRQARRYSDVEAEAARAGERLVASRGFASALGQIAENTAALNRLSHDVMDLVTRNLRIAGRRDIVRLAQQLGRNEDKLERVLQEVEALRDELAAARHQSAPPAVTALPARNGASPQATTNGGRRRAKPADRAGAEG